MNHIFYTILKHIICNWNKLITTIYILIILFNRDTQSRNYKSKSSRFFNQTKYVNLERWDIINYNSMIFILIYAVKFEHLTS